LQLFVPVPKLISPRVCFDPVYLLTLLTCPYKVRLIDVLGTPIACERRKGVIEGPKASFKKIISFDCPGVEGI
jgi:hypothetical protein